MSISYANEISVNNINKRVNTITTSTNSQTITPNYLAFEITAIYGWLWHDWDVKIYNPNNFTVQVKYNQRMCFLNDARTFSNLSDINNISIAPNSSTVVRINSNGTADYITACVEYSLNGSTYREVTYANELQANPFNLTMYYNLINI